MGSREVARRSGGEELWYMMGTMQQREEHSQGSGTLAKALPGAQQMRPAVARDVED